MSDPALAAAELTDERGRLEPTPIGPILGRRDLGGYRGMHELLGALAEPVARGARVRLVGRSARGLRLFGFEVGPPEATDVTVVVAGLHPIEWIGVETAMTLLEALAERPPPDRRVFVVPIANPDGFAEVEANLRAGRRRFVRHNARGVDLNRNFPSFWGWPSLARLLLGPVFARGKAAASEPEVRALVDTLVALPIDRALSLHSFGGAVLHPYGARLARPGRLAELEEHAGEIARASDPRRPYRVAQSSRWVPGFTATGMEIDWFYDHHGALALLVECSRGGLAGRPWGDLARAASEPFAWFNPREPAPVATAIAAACLPFVRGVGGPE
ncbi:MAG: succinylglutamate desuccinylase/aspartoacylase family protein [Polyangiaceae bacterium]|nr:succinylglutamate desuccinylase/aspartoacylase family protein [Polyangiaceae bacterium]